MTCHPVSHRHRIKLRYRFAAFFLTLVCLVRKPVPARSYDGAGEKKPQGGLCSYLPGGTRKGGLGASDGVEDVDGGELSSRAKRLGGQ